MSAPTVPLSVRLGVLADELDREAGALEREQMAAGFDEGWNDGHAEALRSASSRIRELLAVEPAPRRVSSQAGLATFRGVSSSPHGLAT